MFGLLTWQWRVIAKKVAIHNARFLKIAMARINHVKTLQNQKLLKSFAKCITDRSLLWNTLYNLELT